MTWNSTLSKKNKLSKGIVHPCLPTFEYGVNDGGCNICKDEQRFLAPLRGGINPVATLLILILVTNILPSGNFKPNVVYGWHATGSSRVSKMVRKGLLSLGAIWGFKPEKKDGPVSKWKVPSAAWSVNPWAAPPGTAWASNRATV